MHIAVAQSLGMYCRALYNMCVDFLSMCGLQLRKDLETQGG